MKRHDPKQNERGAALVEFAIGATLFLTAIFAVLEFGRLLWIHNALVDATRRGARYAVTQGSGSVQDVKRMTVYGNTGGTGAPLVNGLTTTNVIVDHKGSLGGGTITVEIQNYDYQFVLPFVGTTLRLPAYHTTLTGESNGYTPPTI